MQDIEFSIQEGKLFMLQTRNGKRCGEAAVKIAVDLVEEGLINKRDALLKVMPEHLDQMLHPRFIGVESSEYQKAVISRGLPASPGAAVGYLAFTNENVVENRENGIPSILVRDEVSHLLVYILIAARLQKYNCSSMALHVPRLLLMTLRVCSAQKAS